MSGMTGISVALGLRRNFGESVEIKRKVFTLPKDLSPSGGMSALTIQVPEF